MSAGTAATTSFTPKARREGKLTVTARVSLSPRRSGTVAVTVRAASSSCFAKLAWCTEKRLPAGAALNAPANSHRTRTPVFSLIAPSQSETPASKKSPVISSMSPSGTSGTSAPASRGVLVRAWSASTRLQREGSDATKRPFIT